MAKFNDSSADDKNMIESYLQDLPVDCVLLDEFNITFCKITDETFIPIAPILKFVKKIQISSDKLTSKSLYGIIEVCNR